MALFKKARIQNSYEEGQTVIEAHTRMVYKNLGIIRQELIGEIFHNSEYGLKEWRIRRTAFMKKYVKQMTADGMQIKVLATILKQLALDEIVRLHNPDLTKAYLKLSNGVDASECGEEIMKKLDLRHVDVLFHNGPDISHVTCAILSYIMSNITEYQASEKGRTFLKGLFTWKIINEENITVVESALMNADAKGIEIFLEYGFHSVVKAKSGYDILPCVYGIPDPKVLPLLKNQGINVDARGCEQNNSPLHFAAEKGVVMNIKFLLNEDANADALNDEGNDPLLMNFYSMRHVFHIFEQEFYGQEEKCFELLLISNSNVFRKISPTRSKLFNCILRTMNYLRRYCMSTIKLLVAHVAIYEVLDMTVEEAVLEFIQTLQSWNDGELQALYKQCMMQVKQMKKDKIGEGCASNQPNSKPNHNMLTILTENPRKIARDISHEDRKTIIRFINRYSEEHFNYYYDATLEQRIKTITNVSTRGDAAKGVIYASNEILEQQLDVKEMVDLLIFEELQMYKCRNFSRRLNNFCTSIKTNSRLKIKKFKDQFLQQLRDFRNSL